MTNSELAKTLNLIADLLQIEGEIIYKILAYRKAADSLTNLGREAKTIWREGGVNALKEIPGVGQAIAEKIDELLETGELEFLEKLKAEVPPSLAEMLEVPDLGPKKIQLFWQELDITTLEGLESAARRGKLRDLPGMGEKSEAKILAGIEALSRRTDRTSLGEALPFAQAQMAKLRELPGVVTVETAGSLRRMQETVGDLDILVASENSQPVMDFFVSQPIVVRVLGHSATKSSLEFSNGMRAQLWVHPPNRFGTALQYATGSKEHNVRMRELALSQGLSLSEHALTRTDDETEILCETEEKVYQTLGLPWIPPELREDRGEIQAAKKGALPRLITRSDIHMDLQTHSTWSDGKASIQEMARAAQARGHKVIAITDHTHSLGVVQGMDPQAVQKRKEEIETAQEALGDSILILNAVEVEIKADGSLDYPDDVLADLDLVLASLHVSLRQPRAQITARLLNAIRNPHVDLIGHPTGRMIPDREGADLDIEVVLKAAAEHDTVLEINANPRRLDLSDVYARRAVEMGIKLSINTDAHAPDHFDYMNFGVATARRAWVQPEHVINTWEPDRLLAWLSARG